jgi:A/G-specific adenine glycosylase
MGPKRKRAQRPASESGVDYDDGYDNSGDSDGSLYNDTRPSGTKKTRGTRQATHRTRKKGRKDDNSIVVNSISGHSVTVHVITAVEPARAALLEWYDRVHDARKMPWRKKFDPSLDVEGRAQRAYEV